MPEAESPDCAICGSHSTRVIFRSGSAESLTSLCQLRPGGIDVSLCTDCSHIRSNELADLAAFYENEFTMLTDSVEQDQIYEKQGDKIIYRSDHQLAVLLDAQQIGPDTRVLDYGCAKADMSRKLKQSVGAFGLHLYDVSTMYLPFWEKLTDSGHWAINSTPAEWQQQFDLVMSFFAFEHIPDPVAAARHVFGLLKPGGTVHLVVPDTFGNIADFVVSDHVNHFTVPSLGRLLAEAGFGDISIDDRSHRGALVARARRSGEPGAGISGNAGELERSIARAREIAAFWSGIDERLHREEDGTSGKAAIYGSGFYGAYIYSKLERKDRIACFLDQSPFQQGGTLFGKPILAPDDLPGEAEVIYVGLNPEIARKAIAAMADWPGHERRLVFLT